MLRLFHKKKNDICSQNSILEKAIRSGLIIRKDNAYLITDFGFRNGCYRTRQGGIGFSSKAILLLDTKI